MFVVILSCIVGTLCPGITESCLVITKTFTQNSTDTIAFHLSVILPKQFIGCHEINVCILLTFHCKKPKIKDDSAAYF
jgi:hypothetical protein